MDFKRCIFCVAGRSDVLWVKFVSPREATFINAPVAKGKQTVRSIPFKFRYDAQMATLMDSRIKWLKNTRKSCRIWSVTNDYGLTNDTIRVRQWFNIHDNSKVTPSSSIVNWNIAFKIVRCKLHFLTHFEEGHSASEMLWMNHCKTTLMSNISVFFIYLRRIFSMSLVIWNISVESKSSLDLSFYIAETQFPRTSFHVSMSSIWPAKWMSEAWVSWLQSSRQTWRTY